ncbi:hypothetical protein EV121DRAFT_275113 [Schizophyllum commune]
MRAQNKMTIPGICRNGGKRSHAVTPGRPLALLLLALHLVPNFHVTGNIALRVLRLSATLARLISRRSDTHNATTTHFYANMSYPFEDTAPHATDDIGHVPEAAGGDHDDTTPNDGPLESSVDVPQIPIVLSQQTALLNLIIQNTLLSLDGDTLNVPFGTPHDCQHHRMPSTHSTLSIGPRWLPCLSWTMPYLASIPLQLVQGNSTETTINRLPPEVLSLIFVAATPAEPTIYWRYMPLVVSWVCGYWRRVAINAPELWKYLNLVSCSGYHAHRHWDLERMFMRRSKYAGINISYADEFTFLLAHVDDPTEQRCLCALDLIMASISETRDLDLGVYRSSIRRLATLPPGAATSLRNLRIKFYGCEDRAQAKALSSLLSTSPRLQSLSLTSDFLLREASLDNLIPWSQLVRVELASYPMPFYAFAEMLTTGVLLEHVSVCLTPGIRPHALANVRVSQTTIEKLDIVGFGPLDDVFRALHLPALRNLKLHMHFKLDDARLSEWPCADPRVLHDFIADGTAPLNSLSLSPGGTIDEDALLDIIALPQMAKLTHLEVQNVSYISDRLFDALLPGRDGKPLLPRLTTLELGRCSTSDGVISHMLRWRMKHLYPLTRLEVTYMLGGCGHCRHHGKDMSAFRRARDAGVYAKGHR